VLDALDQGLQESVVRMGTYLQSRLQALAAAKPDEIAAVRGAGLMAGLDLRRDATSIVNAALERRLLVNRTATTVIRLLPPYIVTAADIDEAVGILEEILN
jgi:acetylornithine/succinyldiaminopimelate/putrescine aminotransferase